ncbi:aquaporin-like protein [Pholiota molesta]|nr:aquaporin-like protein [Pholiota molesta]
MQSSTTSLSKTLSPNSPPTHDENAALDSYFPPQAKPKSRWCIIRTIIREPMAEFAGVAVFVMLGTAVDCQVVLSTNKGVASSPKGDFLSVNFGWAIGLAMGAWVSGGISGGHLNPAVTLALASWRGFPWRKVPAYIFAQVLGGLFGAAVVYGNYASAIDIFEGGHGIRTRATGGLFATYALDYMSNISCFFVEFLGTALLVLMVLAATDKKNNSPPKGLLPLTLFLTLLGLGLGFGMQTSYAFNPARDFGPRLLLTFAGYGKQLYSYRSQYWLWCPIIGPIVGAQIAAIFYDLFLNENGRFGEDEELECTSPKTLTPNDCRV